MDAVDMSLHFIAVGLSACSLYCFFKGSAKLESGFAPCPISEKTARIIGKYAFAESSVSIDARSLKVENSNDQYYMLSSDCSDNVLVVSRMGGSFHWERKSSRIMPR